MWLSTVVLLLAPWSTGRAQPPASTAPFVPGEILVKFKAGVSTQKATSVFATCGLRALGIERVQTEVDWQQLDLLAFSARRGFQPAPRLCLELRLDPASE